MFMLDVIMDWQHYSLY